jgi:hypothetical protein
MERQPSFFSPCTPSPACADCSPRPPEPRLSTTLSPGSASFCTSGTTISVPVNTTLSPALAFSTVSWRQITSTERGMLPAGISSAFSCARMRCQSTKTEWSTSKFHPLTLSQAGFLHMIGLVYLNCCSTLSAVVPHSWHANVPKSSSGRTSDVRVTVAVMDTSWPIFSVRRSRTFET